MPRWQLVTAPRGPPCPLGAYLEMQITQPGLDCGNPEHPLCLRFQTNARSQIISAVASQTCLLCNCCVTPM